MHNREAVQVDVNLKQKKLNANLLLQQRKKRPATVARADPAGSVLPSLPIVDLRMLRRSLRTADLLV